MKYSMKIKKIAKAMFCCREMVLGYESGGIYPLSNILSVVANNGKVTIRYRYQKECGLSDCVYHPIQDIQEEIFEFDQNAVFTGNILEALGDDGNLFDDTKNLIRNFFNKYPEQRPAKLCNY